MVPFTKCYWMSSTAEQSNVIPSGTSASVDGSSRSTSAPVPIEWFKIFDGPGENAGVRPYGVKVVLSKEGKDKVPGGWEAKKPGTQGWRGFTSEQKEEAYNHADISMSKCPIDGRPVPIGVEQVQTLVNYLRNIHPGEFQRLVREAEGRIRTLYVYPDCYSVSRRFINHRFPDISFETKSQLDMALKTGTPLFPETDCHHGNKCRGLKGGCGFNHPDAGWCEWEKSSTKRCHSKFCAKNHGRGRMKFITNSSSGGEKSPKSKDEHVKSESKPMSSNPFQALIDEEQVEVKDGEEEPLIDTARKVVGLERNVELDAEFDRKEKEKGNDRAAADEEGFVTPKKRGSKKTPNAPVKRKNSKTFSSNFKSSSKKLFEEENDEPKEVECVVLKPEDLGMTEQESSKKSFKKAAQEEPSSDQFPQLSESEVQEPTSWKGKIAETKVKDAEAHRRAEEKKIEEQTIKLEEEKQKLEEAKQKLDEKKRALQEIEDEKKRVQEEMEEHERLLKEEEERKEQETVEKEEERKRKIQERLDAGVEGLEIITPKKERDLDEGPPKKGSKKAKKQGKNKGTIVHWG